MNKYAELSDFEINKKVALHVGGLALSLTVTNDECKGSFNPCNNPADAMPIIIESKISMTPTSYAVEWVSSHRYFRAINKNPLRAAMEVFLMMKDEQISKVKTRG